jgi:hypothetical protein
LKFDPPAIPAQFTRLDVQLKNSETDKRACDVVGLRHGPILAQEVAQSLAPFPQTRTQLSAYTGIMA